MVYRDGLSLGAAYRTPITAEEYHLARLREQAEELHSDLTGRTLPEDAPVGRFALACDGAAAAAVRFYPDVEGALASIAELVARPAAAVELYDLGEPGAVGASPLAAALQFTLTPQSPRLGGEHRAAQALAAVGVAYERLYRVRSPRSAGVIVDQLGSRIGRFLLVTSEGSVERRVRTWERSAELSAALDELPWGPHRAVLVADLDRPLDASGPSVAFAASAVVGGALHRVDGRIDLEP